MSGPIRIDAVQPLVFRAPLAVPVQTSFGIMHSRPMLLVRLSDDAGNEGWGEIWCNFPVVGAEYRARLLDKVIAPLMRSVEFESPAAMHALLTDACHVLSLQCGEPGPFAQVLAGIDMAAWDLLARRADLPLYRYLGGTDPRLRVYASGLNPTAPQVLVERKSREGYRDFKLKVGFGIARDLENLRAIRAVSESITLMVDANQAWSPEQALENLPRMQGFDLAWVEEPLRSDQPWPVWQQLRDRSGLPLAAGENIAGDAAFDAALRADTLAVVQPDIAKWGGISRGLPLARRIQQAGLRFCPHYLGGGVGLLASAHLLAAVGRQQDVLEVDANDNPMRETLQGPLGSVREGFARLGEEPGIGVVPDLAALRPFQVDY